MSLLTAPGLQGGLLPGGPVLRGEARAQLGLGGTWRHAARGTRARDAGAEGGAGAEGAGRAEAR